MHGVTGLRRVFLLGLPWRAAGRLCAQMDGMDGFLFGLEGFGSWLVCVHEDLSCGCLSLQLFLG